MPTTSARLGLLAPVGGDFPSEYRLSAAANAAVLDNAAIYLPPGLLSARPVSPAAGSFYRATDTGLLYEYNGTAWQTIGPQLAPRFTISSITANPGDLVIPTAVPITITLPTPAGGSMVAVEAPGGATGAAPVTVAPHASESIYGAGLNANVSFLLGTPGVSVVLVADGTNWRIVAGQQDTGWVAPTLTGWTNIGAGAIAAGYRKCGDKVELRGAITGSGAPAFNLPAGFRPTGAISYPSGTSVFATGDVDVTGNYLNGLYFFTD
jgi:hypothetical protein